MNDIEISDLCKEAKATIGLKIYLRRQIEKHFGHSVEKKSSGLSLGNDQQEQQLENQKLSNGTTQIPMRVLDILKNGPKGALLLGRKNDLSDSLRSLIVENISNYLLDNECTVSPIYWQNAAAEIVQIFPKESAVRKFSAAWVETIVILYSVTRQLFRLVTIDHLPLLMESITSLREN